MSKDICWDFTRGDIMSWTTLDAESLMFSLDDLENFADTIPGSLRAISQDGISKYYFGDTCVIGGILDMDGMVDVSIIRCCGEGSAKQFEEIVVPLLRNSEGTLHAELVRSGNVETLFVVEGNIECQI